MATQDGEDLMRMTHSAQQIDDFLDSKNSANGVCPLDAGGLVPIANIPPTVIERIVTVADDTARFALTTADVQNGDTVKVLSNSVGTNVMYLVTDDTQLSSEAGYQVYTAGSAAQADKLTTARNIGGALFDGSGDCTPLASDVSYDPTASGLAATTVQAAVDELATAKSLSLGSYSTITADSAVITYYTAGAVKQLRISISNASGLVSGTAILPAGTIPNPPGNTRVFAAVGRTAGVWATAEYFQCVLTVTASGGLEIQGNDTSLARIKYLATTFVWIA